MFKEILDRNRDTIWTKLCFGVHAKYNSIVQAHLCEATDLTKAGMKRRRKITMMKAELKDAKLHTR